MLWIIPFALLGMLVFAGVFFSRIVIFPRTKSVEDTYRYEVEDGKIDEAQFNRLAKEEVTIRSPYGYDLFGLYVPQDNAKRTAILVHGITYTLYGSVKYLDIFHKRGFNVLMYDHRNHGRSGGHDTSYGFYEKHDLQTWVDWVLERCGADCIVGTHGESMGAATVLQHAAIDPRIAFVVADCPFADAREEFAYRLRIEYHLPGWILLPVASLITKLRKGWFFGEASAIKTLDRVKTPVFFIHGEDDDYIPPEASTRMFERKIGVKKLYLAPNAAHAEALWHNQETYDRLVGEFLEEIGIL